MLWVLNRSALASCGEMRKNINTFWLKKCLISSHADLQYSVFIFLSKLHHVHIAPDNSGNRCFSLFLHNIYVHAEIDNREKKKKTAGDMSITFPA